MGGIEILISFNHIKPSERIDPPKKMPSSVVIAKFGILIYDLLEN